MAFGQWPKYVPVAKQRANAQKAMDKLRKKGLKVQPIEIEGRKIAKTFWGEAWCNHLEQLGDFENRLPRGKRYVRNGSVCHLEMDTGVVKAKVSGSSLYDVTVTINPLHHHRWKTIQQQCTGQIGSLLELLGGQLSDQVMQVVTHPEQGLFPQPKDIQLDCSCPDWANMCKHVAAVLYGVGALLDQQPELLFTLRGVDHQDLISETIEIPTGAGKRRRLTADVGDVFGIELENTPDVVATPRPRSTKVSGSEPTSKRAPTSQSASVSKSKPTSQSKANKKSEKIPKQTQSTPQPNLQTDKITSATVMQLRKRFGLSREDFAIVLGVSTASVSNWESKGGALNLRGASKEALQWAMTLEKDEVDSIFED